MQKFEKILKYKVLGEIPFLWILPLLICSYYSVGFHHYDEHFQILEFANYKMGLSPVDDLPWEFENTIRSTIQPTLTVCLWKLYQSLFSFNPFIFAFTLRAITALLSIWILYLLRQTFLKDADEKKINLYYSFSFLLWFMPFVMVRYSSETWSAFMLGLGLYWVLHDRPKWYNWFLGGIFLGLGFWFRFQIAFALFGYGVWAIFINKTSFKSLLNIAIGFVIISVTCIWVDRWFYGSWVLSPYQYYYHAIHTTKQFDNYGAWYYPALYLLHLIPPISIIVVVAVGYFIIKYRTHPISWIFLAFVLPHFIISHKEVRFLYPMFIFLPSILVISYRDFLISNLVKLKAILHFWKVPILVINFALLILICFKPADIRIFNLKQLSQNGKLRNLIALNNQTPQGYFPDLKMNYYQSFTKSGVDKSVFLIDTSSQNLIEEPFLINSNDYRYLFLTKMGDNFEEYNVHLSSDKK